MIEIKACKGEDIDEILEIERDAFSPPWTKDQLDFERQSPDADFITVKSGGEILGYAIMHSAADEGEIYKVAVKASARRDRLATALVKVLIRCAENRGLTQMFLEVRSGNVAAIALYEKNGFTAVGRRKNYYTNPTEDALLYTRDMKVNENDHSVC